MKILQIILICLIAIFIFDLGDEKNKFLNLQKEYIIAAEAVNDIKFDSLKNNEDILSDGTYVKIETPTKYPDDRIIYYKDIVLSVENDNGLAKVITGFEKDGEEIPESLSFSNFAIVTSFLLVISQFAVISMILVP